MDTIELWARNGDAVHEAMEGHPFKPGHPDPSMTCREGLTTLPGSGQLINL
jgi:hypothetical protein